MYLFTLLAIYAELQGRVHLQIHIDNTLYISYAKISDKYIYYVGRYDIIIYVIVDV